MKETKQTGVSAARFGDASDCLTVLQPSFFSSACRRLPGILDRLPNSMRPAATWARLGVIFLSALPLFSAAASPELPPAANHTVDFITHVRPMLERCVPCHGPAQQMNGLRLDARQAALKGGYSGPVILPGKSAESPLILRLASEKEGFRMPPVGPALALDEIGVLRAWIDQGARWPQSSDPAVQETKVAAKQSTHWAFQPIHRLGEPVVRQTAWVRNAIDRFVLAKLEAEGISPSPEAGKITLIRRLSFDLIGLPPSPEQVRDFLRDDSPEAYEALVDRLLESPHYGEKWARHWLDLARYADSDGYEKDWPRPYAWRWRHWVINALNDDMPFDQFTLRQIAGDLLPHPTVEGHVATGFHRNTLTNREGGVNEEQTRFEEVVDRANTVGAVWLGLTVGCAQCHDHKYDPITQKDYYQIFAFFDNPQDGLIDAPLEGERGPYLSTHVEYREMRQELLNEYMVSEIQPGFEEKLKLAARNPGKWTDWDLAYASLAKVSDDGQQTLGIEPSRRTLRQADTLTNYLVEWSHFGYGKKRYEELGFDKLLRELEKLEASYPQLTQARVIFEPPDRHPTHIRLRGDYQQKSIEVSPDTPAFLPVLSAESSPSGAKPNRLDLAHWLVSRDNPLTARVAVNRMWQEFFGKGLVVTSEDFGTQGEPPSHPGLLDWLAADFIEGDWSVKRMHKQIAMSATYRQASRFRPELTERDPNNTWLARQSRLRLPAELIRDAALAASGLLYPEVGGKSVRPPQPEAVSQITYGKFGEWKTSPGKQQYRRGLYVHFQRTSPYPLLKNFDAPDSNTSCARRLRSNTPLQALNALNDPVFLEAAQALAVRALDRAPANWDARVDYAFQLCVSRKPSASEKKQLGAYFAKQKAVFDAEPAAVQALTPLALGSVEPVEMATWVALGRALLNLDEFITRE